MVEGKKSNGGLADSICNKKKGAITHHLGKEESLKKYDL